MTQRLISFHTATLKYWSAATFLIAGLACNTWASSQIDPKAKPKAHATKTAYHRSAPQGPLYATRADAMEAADEIAQKRELDPRWVRHVIGQARYMESVSRAITPPPTGTPKNWLLYRSRFIDPVRIKAGVKFWLDNQDALQRAEEETGVPPAIVVGIVGVETIYGKNTGSYRVIDALCTLAFDFPQAHPKAQQRRAFFRSELEAYLALTQRTGTNPLALRGSYAGAMGLPQFMPSSWDKYAVDFDGDGRVDLFHSQTDVIGSVANYFKAFRWQRGMRTHYAVQLDPTTLDKAKLLAPDILPTFAPADFVALGALLDDDALQHPGPLALVELQNGDAAPQYMAGTQNFYAITRYNWSSYYAMAVIELGNQVEQAVARQRAVSK